MCVWGSTSVCVSAAAAHPLCAYFSVPKPPALQLCFTSGPFFCCSLCLRLLFILSVFLLFLHTSAGVFLIAVFSPGSDIHHELRSSAVRVAVAPEYVCQVGERAESLYLDE